MRAEKKEMKSDQVTLVDIKNDNSVGKVNSHILIKAMLQKHPNVFESRLYTINDIETLLKAYGANKKGFKKSILANKLVELINTNNSMVDTSAFDV